MIKVFDHDEELRAGLQADLEAPSLYDEFLRFLARRGHDVPVEVLERDVTQPYVASDGVIEVLRRIYADPDTYWDAYEMCEELVDVEGSFQLWRFRHLKTVARIIGFKRGTGGSSGVNFLQKALELTFFPELLDVRTHIGAP
jgi:tryptophan 2,3-dioxygenase